jgi:flagellar biosynthesis/type III secretory pathway M-ring protein FliF/YscJ
MITAILLAAATPEPSAPPPELVTPGPWGFAAIAFIALAVFLLVWDMLRRIRRGRYRSEINEDLDAAEAQAREAEEASAVDDQDIDPQDDPARH